MIFRPILHRKTWGPLSINSSVALNAGSSSCYEVYEETGDTNLYTYADVSRGLAVTPSPLAYFFRVRSINTVGNSFWSIVSDSVATV